MGESSRSIYERAKEHVADREKQSEDSHQIKHWLTSHEDLLAPPGFKFKIIQSFQDPLSRQLAEAVRIDLRGENILNSKAEYSRCRVPRLRIDMEGWKEKTKEKEKPKETENVPGKNCQSQGKENDQKCSRGKIYNRGRSIHRYI